MTAYYMDGRHRTKVHIRVKTRNGSVAWCGTHSSYSKDVMEVEAFRGLPEEKQCKRCKRALRPPSLPSDGEIYSLASFGGDKAAKDAFVAETLAALTTTAQGEVERADEASEAALAAFDEATNVYASYMGDPDGNDDTYTAKHEAAKVLDRFARDHRLAFSHPGEVGKVVAWLKSGGYRYAASCIERGDHLSTPDTVSLKGDRV